MAFATASCAGNSDNSAQTGGSTSTTSTGGQAAAGAESGGRAGSPSGGSGGSSIAGSPASSGAANAGAASGGAPSKGGSTSTGGAGGNGGAVNPSGGSTPGGAAASAGNAARGGSNDPGGAPAGGTGGGNVGGDGLFQMERLNRGVVAVSVTGGVYIGWRLLGFEYDPMDASNIAFNVYRGSTKLATVTDSTNYLDAMGTATSEYSVRAVVSGVEQAASEVVKPWAQNYLRIPLQPPSNVYTANDASVGDADGDGRYEIYLKWDPNDAKDNSQTGVTSNVFIDALALDGKRLWRIDLGKNIRAGAHYTQFVVHDFDGDGKAEIAMKTAPGTKDGSGKYLQLGPAANDDDSAVYRNADGFVLSGPEYLTVFNGATGAELATVNFDVGRGTVSAWGDDYGNRVDRFLATAAYLDDSGLPSFVMARGYYTRATLTAWNFRAGTLRQLWKFDSNATPKDAKGNPFTGQGAHSMTVANADDDPQQEIMFGAAEIDHDGKGLCSTGFNHGDAEHVGDLIPSRPGLEFFMCNEDGTHPAYHVRDIRTCEIIQKGPINGDDTGRCVAEDILASSPGAELWASSVDGLLSATTNANVGAKPGAQNFLIYWDGDESRELQDGTTITKYGMNGNLLNCAECASNNGTKSSPTLTADLLGDWREEIIWRESNGAALRLYTTTHVTARRIYTLMHDPQYRMQVSAEQTGYNQPPHTGFHIGGGMVAPPRPNIKVR